MAKMNWDKAKPYRPAEQAFPTDKMGRNAARVERRWARKLGLTDELAKLEQTATPTPTAIKDRPRRMSAAEIDEYRSAKGGWDRAGLARLGVPWPPPQGWRKALLEGRPIPGAVNLAQPEPSQPPSRPYVAKPRDFGSGPKAPWED